MTEIKLRDYQREAIDAVFKAWSDGMRRPAIVLPTGAGKTVVFSALVREWMSYDVQMRHCFPGNPFPGRRVMILAHRDELVDQAIAKLRAVMPGVDVGKVKAESNDIGADVMVCSVQTLAARKRIEQVEDSEVDFSPIGLIITDECHHAAAASYKKIYDAFPDALQLGVTATMARGDGVGLGKVWDDVVYQRSILWMISKGYLTDVRTKHVDLTSPNGYDHPRARPGEIPVAGLDFSKIKTSGGDWAAGDLGRALMEAEADTAIARAYKEHAGTRQGIVFTPTVETAEAAMQALASAGIRSAMVSGDTPREQRQQIYEKFRTGQVQVMTNCMVLTEGFDMPQAEVAVIARPTQSAPLYTQMVGRVLRPWPGKKEALVLDLVGASANKLRTLIDLEPGVIQVVRDGETLAEAVEREVNEATQTAPGGTGYFELKVRDVDAFASSEHAWNRTPKGVMFIACGRTYVFLWAAKDGLWDVCTAERGKKWQRTQYTGLDLGSAMAWGEAVSEDHYSGYGTTRGAAWRKKKPSEAAIRLGFSVGITDPGAWRAGQLSDEIDRRLGARFFDRHVKG